LFPVGLVIVVLFVFTDNRLGVVLFVAFEAVLLLLDGFEWLRRRSDG